MSIVLRTASANVKRAADEIVLHVNNQECVHRTNNLIENPFNDLTNLRPRLFYRFYPKIPAKRELIAIDETIAVLIENLENFPQFIVGQHVHLTLVIAEQSTANQAELIQRQ